MAFGKRGLVRNEEPHDSAVSYPVLPPNATTIEWLTGFWKLCKVLPGGIGQGVISFGYHVLLSAVLAVAILFIKPTDLARFADGMRPYWPLLSRARPYMDAHGHHQLFLYMSAAYFKDMALIIFFSIRNIFWVIMSFIMFSSKMKIRFRSKTFLVGLIAPLALVFWLGLLYYGPSRIPPDVLHRSVFDGDVYWGIVFPALLLEP
ncbi:MAG TPA: hypothetical protein VMU56_08910, partial [Beijerinckiaceae bacterium]|nr:hypothetical protein [Beijerinckiaceae bacterium]